MIAIHMIPVALSRSGAVTGASPQYQASATVDGVLYTTQSKSAASCKLARILFEASCPDQPWECRNAAGKRTTYGGSLHNPTKFTVAEGAMSPRFAKWIPRPDYPGPLR